MNAISLRSGFLLLVLVLGCWTMPARAETQRDSDQDGSKKTLVELTPMAVTPGLYVPRFGGPIERAPIHGPGLILDREGKPAASVRVSTVTEGNEVVRRTTAKDGRYAANYAEFIGTLPPGGMNLSAIIARRGSEVALGVAYPRKAETLVLGAGHRARVVVTDGGRPVAQARIGLYTRAFHLLRLQLGFLEADENGVVELPLLPFGTFEIVALGSGDRRAEGVLRFPTDDDRTLELKLTEGRKFRVRVIEKESWDPVAGVQIFPREPGRPDKKPFEVDDHIWDDVVPRLAHAVAPTDDEGWTEIRGVDPEATLSAVVILNVGADVVSVEQVYLVDDETIIEIERPRPARLFVKDWGGEAPSAGTTVEVTPLQASPFDAGPRPARTENSFVILKRSDGALERGVSLRLPDGRWAEAHEVIEDVDSEGLVFKQPVRVEIRVLNAEGDPLAGFLLSARTWDGVVFAEAVSDDEGRATLKRLPLMSLIVDCREPGAASTFNQGGDPVDLEDPRNRAMVFTIPPALEIRARVDLEDDHDETPLEVPLRSLGCLVLQVESGELESEIELQRWSEIEGWRDPFYGQGRDSPRLPVVVDGVTAGRYRLLDRKSGLASREIDLEPGAFGVLRLDLRRMVVVRGRVRCPDETAWPDLRILVFYEGQDDDLPAARAWGSRRQVEKDGSFEVAVSLERPVTLEVWHPFLAAHDERGHVTISELPEEIELELIAGNRARFDLEGRVSDPIGFGSARSWRTLLRPRDGGPTVATTTFLDQDERIWFGKFRPGRYEVWIDLAPHAPLVIEEIELGAGTHDYGSLAVSNGSTVDCEIDLDHEHAGFGRLTVEIHRIDGLMEKRYRRWFDFGWSGQGELSGLESGRYEIRITELGGCIGPTLIVEVDGKSAYHLSAEMPCRRR